MGYEIIIAFLQGAAEIPYHNFLVDFFTDFFPNTWR